MACTQKYPLKILCISVEVQRSEPVWNTLYSCYTGLEITSAARFWSVVFLWCLQQGNSWPDPHMYHNVQPYDEPWVEERGCTGNCKIWKMNNIWHWNTYFIINLKQLKYWDTCTKRNKQYEIHKQKYKYLTWSIPLELYIWVIMFHNIAMYHSYYSKKHWNKIYTGLKSWVRT